MYIVIAFISFLFFAYKRTLFYSLFFQQERYNNKKFTKFIFNKFQLIDKKLSLILFLYTIFATGTKIYNLDIVVLSVLFILFGVMTPNPKSKSTKVKLSLTSKMKKILFVSLLTTFILSAKLFYYTYTLNTKNIYCFCEIMGYLILLIQSLPFTLMFGKIVISPLEIFIRHKYLSEAKKILKDFNPVIIGITGSFGKTSTKNILQHILSSVSSSIATSRSVNTLMGVTKFIREEFNQPYKYFIVEIGTSSKGKIKKICNLVKPKYGILTAIGFAHVENFKTKDAIAKEKFDLIKSVQNNDGTYIINPYSVEDKYIKKYHASATDFKIENLKTTFNGISFTLDYCKNKYDIQAPIFGEHQAYNISIGFIMALKLGVLPETILAGLKTLPQIEHRLEVKKQPNGPTIIDDAFNSNLNGFESGLDTLNLLAHQSNGRAILITPGMVELGPQHDSQHEKVALKAVKTCDIVIAVVPDRIKSFVDTFKSNKSDKQEIILVNSLKEGQEWLRLNANSNDVILYENDLPDVFENKINI